MQLSRFSLLAAIARGYSVIFRGTPLILQMVFAYDALPHIGIKLPAIAGGGPGACLQRSAVHRRDPARRRARRRPRAGAGRAGARHDAAAC